MDCRAFGHCRVCRDSGVSGDLPLTGLDLNPSP